MIVDLHFVTIMHRHPCFTGFDGNTDENSRIVVFIANLEHNVNFTVADLSSHAVEQAHSAVRAGQPGSHATAPGASRFPACEIFASAKLRLHAGAQTRAEVLIRTHA